MSLLYALKNSPNRVVVEFVEAAQCLQGTETERVAEEDLGARICPHLQNER